MKALHDQIRATLTKHPDGLSCKQIAEHIFKDPETVRTSLATCFGVYIDRWTTSVRGGQWRPPCAVWCVVNVPDDCQRP